MSSSDRKKVLVIGLKAGADPNPSQGEWTAERVMEGIKEQFKLAAQAGFDMTVYSIDTSKTFDATMDEARAELKKEKWDGVSIGFGVRGNEKFTPLFERLVNTTVAEVHPPPTFIFASRPTTVWTDTSRVFGVDQTGSA